MTASEAILSQEEIAAILAEEASTEDPRAIAAARRANPLFRALTAFAEEQSRLLSTLHQRPIHFALLRVESLPVASLAAMYDERDRVFALRSVGAPGTGAIAVGRGVLFGWLAMAFGAPATLGVPIPSRGFTRIEARLLRRLAADLSEQLSSSISESLPGPCQLGELLEPALLVGLASPRLLCAAFDVHGLGDVGRLRVALPESWVSDVDQSSANQPIEGRVDPACLMDLPLEVRAEVAEGVLPLAEIGRLQVGDVLPLDGHPLGRIRVRIAGKPSFEALPGSSGARAAIQIVSE